MTPFALLLVSEPCKDGVFDIVRELVRHLHRTHPEVTVDLAYSSHRSGSALPGLLSEIERHGGSTIDLHVGNAPCLRDLAALKRLISFTHERKHHLVHALSSKAGAIVRTARLLSALFPFPRTLYQPQSFFGMARRGGIREKVFNAIESVLGRVGLTICCSRDEYDFATTVLGISPQRLRHIDNGIDTDRFIPADPYSKTRARASLNLPSEGKLLVTIGRDSDQKNYGTLYQALQEILPDASWFFAHAGEGSAMLRAMLPERARARCYSYLYLADVLPLLHAADGFIMTSRYEGLSLAMLMALSCGLPAFLPDAPGFRFLKDRGFTEVERLSDPNDRDAFQADLVKKLTLWGSGKPRLHPEQHVRICRMFSQSLQFEKVIELYINCTEWTNADP